MAEDDIDPAIGLAIKQGARAGMYWKAARANPHRQEDYTAQGVAYHEWATVILEHAVARLLADGERSADG